MIGDKLKAALNSQVNAELYSSYLYLSMAAYFEGLNLAGFSQWMRIQAQEELIHGMKLYDFILERGGTVTLEAIEKPEKEWESPLAVFENAYAHEQKVTGLINGLVNLAIDEKDHATNQFLQWFVSEQVEEEASASDVVQKLKLAKDAPGALYMIDKEVGARVEVLPLAAALQKTNQ